MQTGKITNIYATPRAIPAGEAAIIYVDFEAKTDSYMDYPLWYTRLVVKAGDLEAGDEQYHNGWEGDRNDNRLTLGVMPNRSLSGTVTLWGGSPAIPTPVPITREWRILDRKSFTIPIATLAPAPPAVPVPVAPSVPPTYPWEPTPTPTPTPTPVISPALALGGFNWTTMLIVGGIALLAFMVLMPQKGKKAAKTKG